MVKGLDKETIYFSFRLDIGTINSNNVAQFVSVTKQMNGRESEIPIHLLRKNRKK